MLRDHLLHLRYIGCNVGVDCCVRAYQVRSALLSLVLASSSFDGVSILRRRWSSQGYSVGHLPDVSPINCGCGPHMCADVRYRPNIRKYVLIFPSWATTICLLSLITVRAQLWPTKIASTMRIK